MKALGSNNTQTATIILTKSETVNFYMDYTFWI